MACIRTIKPEFWTDDAIMRVSHGARLFFIGMLNFATDDGVLKDSPLQLKAQIFPGDAMGAGEIESLLSELQGVSLVMRYEVKNEKYIYIRNFSKHQRIDRPRTKNLLPLPPEVENQLKSAEIISGKERKGKESKKKESRKERKAAPPSGAPNPPPSEEKKLPPPVLSDFERWWREYPNRRKTGKPQCLKKWRILREAKQLPPIEDMLTVLSYHKRTKDWQKNAGEFIPGPHRYLNEMRFNDDVPRPVSVAESYQKGRVIIGPENAHQFADPKCPECQGKGMVVKQLRAGMPPMRVQCPCTEKHNPKENL